MHQNVVDNFRRRHHPNLEKVLQELWRELERRFGNTAALTNALLARLAQLARLNEKDLQGLQMFADLCGDVDSQLAHLPGLSCLNFPNVMRPVVEKLPAFLRTKWEKEIVKYAARNNDSYPVFHVFARMVQEEAQKKNHPNVQASGVQTTTHGERPPRRATRDDPIIPKRVLKTKTTEEAPRCAFHDREGHTLTECRAFNTLSIEEKTDWVLRKKLCFRCLEPNHVANECKTTAKCSKCGSDRHPTLLHKQREDAQLKSNCTSVCGTGGVSCSKIVLVDVYHQEHPQERHRVYAVMDDQSNASMVTPDLATKLKARDPPERYLLSTCNGERMVKYGHRVSGVLISANDVTSKLPTLVECAHIPQDKSEIPTPDMVRRFDQLKNVADHIPPFDPHAKIQILIGRDAPELLKVRVSKNGPKGAPWAQKLDLGWTISGQVCLNRMGGPFHISARRTTLSTPEPLTRADDLPGGGGLAVSPCPNHFQVKEDFGAHTRKALEADVYHTTKHDNEVDLSWEDKKFLDIMEQNIHKNEKGNWVMPLPFRSPDASMPNNREQATSRLNSLLRTLKRKPQMATDYFQFLGKVFEKGHAIPVSTTDPKHRQDEGKVWYLPHFGVYHPKKPTQIRVVFDSSAEYKGVSLNKELLTGPDLTNSLFGVLLRFRHHDVAAMCDVEQMFHSFRVDPKHQSFLRFLWFRNNDPSEEIIEYQMTVHLFGNGPSPAVATFGLRKTAIHGEEPEVRKFVHRNFYVDDGLVSRATPQEVIKLITDAQATLATANIRLHKVVSNAVDVMEALPADDRAKDVRDLDLRKETLPSQRSLGVQWSLEEDKFSFKVSRQDKPFTRRGVLSIINSIYDPMGIAVPVTLKGKQLLQQLVAMGKTRNGDDLGWDDPLPEDLMRQWQRWKEALPNLEEASLARCLHPRNFGPIARAELHAFSDASEDAIGVAIYLRLTNHEDRVHVSFVFGQSRVAPTKPTSIPRLELCGAVLCTQAVRKILAEIDMDVHGVTFHTDSKVVLGCIRNETRRFYSYVTNRVQIIRNVSSPDQWSFVDTNSNPADLATRGLDASKLGGSQWLEGPQFLREANWLPASTTQESTLTEDDPEVRRVTAHSTRITADLGTSRLSRFSSWPSLQRAVATLIAKTRVNGTRKEDQAAIARHNKDGLLIPTVGELEKATTVLLKVVQAESFEEDIKMLYATADPGDEGSQESRSNRSTSKKSRLYGLDPFIDDDGVLRVGGRLRRSSLDSIEKHPAILPKDHHVSELLIRHYHQTVHHQGRQITHVAVRQAGYWVISGHSAVTRMLSSCVPCKRTRGMPITHSTWRTCRKTAPNQAHPSRASDSTYLVHGSYARANFGEAPPIRSDGAWCSHASAPGPSILSSWRVWMPVPSSAHCEGSSHFGDPPQGSAVTEEPTSSAGSLSSAPP